MLIPIQKIKNLPVCSIHKFQSSNSRKSPRVVARFPPDDQYYQEIGERYKSVRQFLPQLLRLVTFEGIHASQAVLKDTSPCDAGSSALLMKNTRSSLKDESFG